MALFLDHNKGDVKSILVTTNHQCNVNPNLNKLSIVSSIKKQEPQTIKESGNWWSLQDNDTHDHD